MKLVILTLATVASSFALASSDGMLGNYSSPTAVRFIGESAADCKVDGGDMIDDSCIIPSTNTVSIEKNDKQEIIVKIEVVYGAAHTREFWGVVTNENGNTLSATEADLSDNNDVSSIQTDGCKMTLTLKEQSLELTANDVCDSNLLRANGSKKN